MLVDNRPTRAHIHLDRLVANYRTAQRLADGKTVMAIVKADAYGHGALSVSRALAAAGCRWFGVASLEEALELRSGGVAGDILLLGGLFPGDEVEALRNAISCTVYDEDVAQRLNAAAMLFGKPASVHLKIDTGMCRLGFDLQGFAGFLRRLTDLPGISVRGMFSHLSHSDSPDASTTDEQATLLRSAHQVLLRAVGEVSHLHLANSAALLLQRDMPGDMVRPGVMLYGAYPMLPGQSATKLEPVMELSSALVQVRAVAAGRSVSYGGTWIAPVDSVLGVVPIGYGDGVPRLISNRGEVIIAGRKVRIVGRVCMDMILIDLTGIHEPRVGQQVTLIGKEGEAEITCEDWAAWAESISYEITCGISRRVPRLFSGSVAGGLRQ